MPPYLNNRNNLTPNNVTAEPINLNSPNLRIMAGNSKNEPIPFWMRPGHVPSNIKKLRRRAANLDIEEDMGAPEPKKFRLGKAPGQNGGRGRRTRRRSSRARRSTTRKTK
jgi:hypothetical protein